MTPPRLNSSSRRLVLETIEDEREIGNPKVATALELLLEWHDAGRLAGQHGELPSPETPLPESDTAIKGDGYRQPSPIVTISAADGGPVDWEGLPPETRLALTALINAAHPLIAVDQTDVLDRKMPGE